MKCSGETLKRNPLIDTLGIQEPVIPGEPSSGTLWLINLIFDKITGEARQKACDGCCGCPGL